MLLTLFSLVFSTPHEQLKYSNEIVNQTIRNKLYQFPIGNSTQRIINHNFPKNETTNIEKNGINSESKIISSSHAHFNSANGKAVPNSSALRSNSHFLLESSSVSTKVSSVSEKTKSISRNLTTNSKEKINDSKSLRISDEVNHNNNGSLTESALSQKTKSFDHYPHNSLSQYHAWILIICALIAFLLLIFVVYIMILRRTKRFASLNDASSGDEPLLITADIA